MTNSSGNDWILKTATQPFVANSVESIYLHRLLGENVTGLACFPQVFSLTCVSPTKAKSGGRLTITLKILIKAGEVEPNW